MNKNKSWLVITFLLISGACQLWAAVDPTTLPLVQFSDLKYVGAFKVPTGGIGLSHFQYGGSAMAYNALNDSLFMGGTPNHKMTAEIKIPQIINDPNVNNLKTATVLQPFIDDTEGLRVSAFPGTNVDLGAHLVYNGKLLGSMFIYYDASNSQVYSHYRRPMDFSALGNVEGLFRITDGVHNARFVHGWMTDIPAEWQPALGGPVLTGSCCTNISAGTSNGPSAFAYDPADLGVKDPVPDVPLFYYPASNPLTAPGQPGGWNVQNNAWNGGTSMGGVVFPQGTRSILYFGALGVGNFCYGNGGTVAPAGAIVQFCYDPVFNPKGGHSFPYLYQIWAYDANDAIAVRNGLKQPWQVQPYGIWNFDLPYSIDARTIKGATYDAQNKRIFITAADKTQYPIVYVFTVGGAGPTMLPSVYLDPVALGNTYNNPASLSFKAQASSPGNVTKVEFYEGANIIGTSVSPPYTASWNKAVGGHYSITAKVYDSNGNTSVSSSFLIDVAAAGGPDITAPVISNVFSDTIAGSSATIHWDTDELADSMVEYCTSNSTCGVFSPLDSTLVTVHALVLTGLRKNTGYNYWIHSADAAGNQGMTDHYTFTSSGGGLNGGADVTPPNVSITAPAANATVSGVVNITVNAADAGGVSKVEFYIDGVLSFTDLIPVYTYVWDTTALSLGSHIILAKAFDTSGNTKSTSISVTISGSGGGNGGNGGNGGGPLSHPAVFRNGRVLVSLTDPAAGNVGISLLPADSGRKTALTKQNLILLGSEVDLALSSGSLSSASITLPYDASLIPSGLSAASVRIAYYNPMSGSWELQDNVSVQGDLALCNIAHFSIYAPVLVLPATVPGISDLYVYPNPTIGGDNPTLHVKMGFVDTVDIDIYDMGGTRVHSVSFPGTSPQIDSDGQYYYEYTWMGEKASGVYVASVKGKTSSSTVKSKVKFAVLK